MTHVVRIHGAWGGLRDVHEEGLGARVCQSAYGVELLSLLRGSNPWIEASLACAWPEHGRCWQHVTTLLCCNLGAVQWLLGAGSSFLATQE